VGAVVESREGLVLAAVVAAAFAVTATPAAVAGLAVDAAIGNPVLPLLCISRTSPADGEDNVSLGAPIVVEFCAPPDLASTWFTLAPSAEPYSFSWSGAETSLTIQHLRPFEPCTQYRATIGSDSGDYTWRFFTVCTFLPGDNLTVRRM